MYEMTVISQTTFFFKRRRRNHGLCQALTAAQVTDGNAANGDMMTTGVTTYDGGSDLTNMVQVEAEQGLRQCCGDGYFDREQHDGYWTNCGQWNCKH